MTIFKRLTLTFVFTLLSAIAFAQDSPQDSELSLLPKAGDFGASIIVDGLIDNISLGSVNNEYGQNILFAKYYLRDNLALRVGFGFSLTNVSNETADSVGVFLVEVDSSRSSYNLNFSGGIEKHLAPTKRLDPFLFSQLDLTFIGKTNTDSEMRQISSNGTNTTTREIKQDGGLAIGLQAGGGFNYFLSTRFSVGTELALRLQYVKLGGTVSDNTVTQVQNVNTTSNFESREDLSKTTNVNVQPNAQINFSYFF